MTIVTTSSYVPPHKRGEQQKEQQGQTNNIKDTSKEVGTISPPRPQQKQQQQQQQQQQRRNNHNQNNSNQHHQHHHQAPMHVPKEEVDTHMKFVDQVLTSIRLINLKRRQDRWKTFKTHLEYSVGKELAQALMKRLKRFDAVDGIPTEEQTVVVVNDDDDDKEEENGQITTTTTTTITPRTSALEQINQTWDATENAKWDRHIQPPMTKQMTPGEIGCALSHIQLWKELAESYNGTDEFQKPTMLILEDDALFYRTKVPEQQQQQHDDDEQQRGRPLQAGQHNLGTKHHHHHQHHYASSNSQDRNDPHHARHHDSNKKRIVPSHGFFTAFEQTWAKLPEDWDILYLGFSDRGERIPVEEQVQFQEAHHHSHHHHHHHGHGSAKKSKSMEVVMFKPTYGFHTHAYVLTATAAKALLDQLPVQGPLDVWLADNKWFGLNVYCSVIANEGWNNTGAWLIPQDRKRVKKDSDICQSGRTMSSD